MIKLIYCLRRRPELSREEFQRYWREKHGPLVVSFKKEMNLHRYVQCHTFTDARMEEARLASGRPEPFDGVAELWWESMEDFAPPNPSPERQKVGPALLEDEMRFIDLPRSPVWLAEEFPFITEVEEADETAKPGNRIKLIYPLIRLPELTREQFQAYWRTNHGPLVRSFVRAMKTRRYVQSHTRYDDINEQMRAAHNRVPGYDGVAELWWDSMEERRPENPEPARVQANQALFEDEKKFIDHAKSPVFLTREWVFVGR